MHLEGYLNTVYVLFYWVGKVNNTSFASTKLLGFYSPPFLGIPISSVHPGWKAGTTIRSSSILTIEKVQTG